MMAGWRMEVTGLRDLMNQLDAIDKKATRHIRSEITRVARSVRIDAAGRITENPIRNWGSWTDSETGRDLSFTAENVAAGFKIQTSTFRKAGVSRGYGVDVRQASAAGSIYEVVGTGQRVRGEGKDRERGLRFVRSINAKAGTRRPRSLFPAYYSAVTPEVKNRIRDRIVEEARKAGLS